MKAQSRFSDRPGLRTRRTVKNLWKPEIVSRSSACRAHRSMCEGLARDGIGGEKGWASSGEPVGLSFDCFSLRVGFGLVERLVFFLRSQFDGNSILFGIAQLVSGKARQHHRNVVLAAALVCFRYQRLARGCQIGV